MADRYWVGGGASTNWNATGNTNWSATSGGANNASVPGTSDRAIFDASSGSGTANISANITVNSFVTTGYTGTWTQGANTLTVSGTTITCNLAAGMTYAPSANTSAIAFTGTSGTADFDSGGKAIGNLTKSGAGTLRLTANITARTDAVLTLTSGTLNLNGFNATFGTFAGSNSNTRTLTVGSGTLELVAASGTVFTTATVTGLTISTYSGSIKLSGGGPTFSGGAITFDGLVELTGVGAVTVSNTGTTFKNLTRAASGAGATAQLIAGDLTVTGTLALAGFDSGANRLLVLSSGAVRGATKQITLGASALCRTGGTANVDFMDIVMSGGAANERDLSAITGGSGDHGNNSGITFTTAATQTYAGGTKSWSDPTAWTSRVPLPQDDVVVATTVTGTLTVDVSRLGANVDFTGYTRTFTVSIATEVNGNLTFSSAMTVSGTATITLNGRGTHTLTTNGKSLTFALTCNCGGGTYLLGGDLTLGRNLVSAFTMTRGTFDANDYNVTTTGANGGVTMTAGTLLMGNGNWTITGNGAGTKWNVTGGTVTGEDSNLILGGAATANDRVFVLGTSQTYSDISYTVASSTGALTLNYTTGVTVQNLNFYDSGGAGVRTVHMQAGATIAVTGTVTANGTAGNLMVWDSTTATSAWTISKASGTVGSNYLNLKDSTATGGATFKAGANSTNGGNNTGWSFVSEIGKTCELDWNVSTSVSDTLALQWNVSTSVFDALAAVWNTQAAIGDTIEARWNVASAVGDSLEAPWNVLAAVSDTADVQWMVSATTSNTCELLWDVLEVTALAVGDNLALLWGVRTSVGDTSDLQWALHATAGDALASVWDTRAAAGDNLNVDWAVNTKLAKTLNPLWAVRELTGPASVELDWSALAAVASYAELRWRINQVAAKAAVLRWNTSKTVADLVDLIWEVAPPSATEDIEVYAHLVQSIATEMARQHVSALMSESHVQV